MSGSIWGKIYRRKHYHQENICIHEILLKFIYSEKATKFCEISTVDLTVTLKDKSTVDISQKFVAFSEYTNFIY